MGWASTLEDAVERLSNALHLLREDSVAGVDPITESRKVEVVDILWRGESVLTEARTYLDIATDPTIDLARSLSEARNNNEAVESRLAGYERSCGSLMRELNRQRQRADDLAKRVEELTRERNSLDKKLMDAMKKNPSAVYDAFPPRSSTPGGQKNAK